MKTPDFFNRNELTRTLWGFRSEFVAAGIFSLVANLLMLTPTIYMLQVYDRVMVSQSTTTLVVVSFITLFFLACSHFLSGAGLGCWCDRVCA
jgi:ATP-binding cassette subfamily C exporter for protease/lipase